MRIDKPTPTDVLRRDYRDMADGWVAGGGTRAEFDALVRELADRRHGRVEHHRPVDLVFAARFIAKSRTDEGYRRWFQVWRLHVSS